MSEFIVWCPERGQSSSDGQRIDTSDPKVAAEIWADKDDWDSTEFRIVSGNPVILCVFSISDRSLTTWTVDGRSARVYTAREVRNP